MTTLVMLLCLTGTPDRCQSVRLSLTMSACMGRTPQLQASLWVREHPGYELRGYRCVMGDPGMDG
jgi:hypothetical protein